MKTPLIISVAAAASLLLLGGCMPMLDSSLDMSPSSGVSIGLGVSTPISGLWGNDSYYPPYWSGSIAGPPAWGVGAPGWNGPWVNPPRPRPPREPGFQRPVITGPGPVIGGSGIPGEGNLPVIRPGTVVNPGGQGSSAVRPPASGQRPGGNVRPGR